MRGNGAYRLTLVAIAAFSVGAAYGQLAAAPQNAVVSEHAARTFPNDSCETAEPIIGPYPVCRDGTLVGAEIDCPGLLDWPAVWYAVDLPYTSNMVTVDFCGTSPEIATVGIVYYNDCTDCNAYVLMGYSFPVCPTGEVNPQLTAVVAGPTTIYVPIYVLTNSLPSNFHVCFNVEIPPSTDCPPEGIPEGESCGDSMNNGCTMPDPSFEPLNCDSTLCGTYWFDGFTRDTDWFEVVLTSPQQFTATIMGEAETIVGLIEQINPGVPGCDNITGYFDVYVVTPAGVPGTIVSECLMPGTYYVWAGSSFAFAFPCPADYVLTFECSPCTTPPGACCVDQVCVGTMEEYQCDAIGGFFFVAQDCDAGFVCPSGCPHTVVLYDAYGDGWNGNTLDVYVNGILMLNQITLPSGAGPLAFEFLAETGAVINTVYYPIGSWTNEPYYIIYDGQGYFLGQDGGDFVQPVGITVTGNCDPATVGACCYYDATCVLTTPEECIDGVYLGLGSQCVQCPCLVPCPDGSYLENEACGDDTNGGCNMASPAFEPLVCALPYCGTYWYDGYTRDTDWYQLILSEPARVTATVEGEATTIVGLIEQVVPGVPGCDNITGYFEVYVATPECTPGSITTDCLLPGTYYFFIDPDFSVVEECPAAYVFQISCEPCAIVGACCDDATGVCNENVNVLECQAPLRFLRDQPCSALYPPCGGCPEDVITIEILTDNYPGETTWELVNVQTGLVECAGGPYQAAGTLYTQECCADASGCYTFTIHDSFGDGICCSYGNGYYNVLYNGVLIATGGEFGSSESVDGFGGCQGACCLEESCIGTMGESECDAADGNWHPGQACPEFVCIPGCEHRITMYDSYGDGWNGNTLDVYVNGNPVLTGITLPSGSGPLSFYFIADYGDMITTVYNPIGDWPNEPYYQIWNGGFPSHLIVQDGGDFVQPTGVTVPGDCGCGCPGACCLPDGTCVVVQEDECDGEFLGSHSDCVSCPCFVPCPENGVPEAEPCGDDMNGGCNATPPVFEPIQCPQTLCGTGWFDGSTRDTDWFAIIATANDVMTWTVQAEFPVLIGLLEQYVPGMPGCNNITGYLAPYALPGECEVASVSFPVTAGGTYYVFVAPQFLNEVDCPRDYTATLSGNNCLCGDFDTDGDVDVMDYYAILDSFGVCVGSPKYLAAADADGDNCITLVDYQSWLVCYEEANGVRPDESSEEVAPVLAEEAAL